MSEHDTEPLDEETRRLLEAEKMPPRAPPGSAARVLERLQVSIIGTPAPEQGVSERTAKGDLTNAVNAPSGPAQHVSRGVLGSAGRIAVAFVVGGIAGASGHAWLTKTPMIPSQAALSTRQEWAPPPSAVMSAPIASADKKLASENAELPSPSESAPKTTSSDLRAERALLDQAQRAFARGDLAASLASLNVHMQRFPRGRLEEEREALAVKALASAARYEEAKTRGARFRARFSDSILLPAVDDALRSIP